MKVLLAILRLNLMYLACYFCGYLLVHMIHHISPLPKDDIEVFTLLASFFCFGAWLLVMEFNNTYGGGDV
jgi:hypothetical protein